VAPLTLAGAFTTWQFAPPVSGPLTLLAAAYLAGVWRTARRRPASPWPASRTLAFLLGLGTVAAATQGSAAVYDDVLFSAHMVQHLLLIMVAPPLLILGRPVTLLLRVSRAPLRNRLTRVLRSPLVSALTCPPVAAALYAAVVIGTHLTPLMNLVVQNTAVHEAEHVLYLVTGYLYFLPVIGAEPIRWRLTAFGRFLLLLAAMPVDTLVGVVLMLASRHLFPAYSDLHQGGLIMLAGSDLIMTVMAVALAAGVVRARSRAERPGGLEAYNAYLAGLGRPRTAADGISAERPWLTALATTSPGGQRRPQRLRSAYV
jgi:putative copper resistance protein D